MSRANYLGPCSATLSNLTVKASFDICNLYILVTLTFLLTEDKEYTVLTEDVLKFLDDVHTTLMHDVLDEGSKRKGKVVTFEHPKDLQVSRKLIETNLVVYNFN